VPVSRNRLGIWKPTLVNGKPIAWEVLLADWDDTNIGFVQVLETDECDKPVKLFVNFIKSFVSQVNTLQNQSVSRGIMIKTSK
jgi:hypothetical protein